MLHVRSAEELRNYWNRPANDGVRWLTPCFTDSMRSTSLILLLAIGVYAVPLVNSHHNEPNRAASPEVSEVREHDLG